MAPRGADGTPILRFARVRKYLLREPTFMLARVSWRMGGTLPAGAAVHVTASPANGAPDVLLAALDYETRWSTRRRRTTSCHRSSSRPTRAVREREQRGRGRQHAPVRSSWAPCCLCGARLEHENGPLGSGSHFLSLLWEDLADLSGFSYELGRAERADLDYSGHRSFSGWAWFPTFPSHGVARG